MSIKETLGKENTVKYGELEFVFDRSDERKTEVAINYNGICLGYRETLLSALEYAYIGVRLCHPDFGNWCIGKQRLFVLDHLTDALKMVGKITIAPIKDERLHTGITRHILLKQDNGYLHPLSDDITVVVTRSWVGESGWQSDTIQTKMSITDHDITIVKEYRESASHGMRDLDQLARELYEKHFAK